MKPIIYFISGLGADHRAYMNINLEGYESIHIEWISPIPNESLEEYAKRLLKSIDQEKPVILIGTSLGGMIAIEISKIISIQKLVLISSVKNINEFPVSFKFFKLFPIYKLFPNFFLQNASLWITLLFGFKLKPLWKRLFIDMFQRMPKGFIKWAFQAILNWENETNPERFLHIHGENDIVFPYHKIKEARLIQGGSHIMVVSRGKEISELILSYLKD